MYKIIHLLLISNLLAMKPCNISKKNKTTQVFCDPDSTWNELGKTLHTCESLNKKIQKAYNYQDRCMNLFQFFRNLRTLQGYVYICSKKDGQELSKQEKMLLNLNCISNDLLDELMSNEFALLDAANKSEMIVMLKFLSSEKFKLYEFTVKKGKNKEIMEKILLNLTLNKFLLLHFLTLVQNSSNFDSLQDISAFLNQIMDNGFDKYIEEDIVCIYVYLWKFPLNKKKLNNLKINKTLNFLYKDLSENLDKLYKVMEKFEEKVNKEIIPKSDDQECTPENNYDAFTLSTDPGMVSGESNLISTATSAALSASIQKTIK